MDLCAFWKNQHNLILRKHVIVQESHFARHRMSPKRMFQKVEPFYICAYRQVYKCTGKKKAGAKHNSCYCIICVF